MFRSAFYFWSTGILGNSCLTFKITIAYSTLNISFEPFLLLAVPMLFVELSLHAVNCSGCISFASCFFIGDSSHLDCSFTYFISSNWKSQQQLELPYSSVNLSQTLNLFTATLVSDHRAAGTTRKARSSSCPKSWRHLSVSTIIT